MTSQMKNKYPWVHTDLSKWLNKLVSEEDEINVYRRIPDKLCSYSILRKGSLIPHFLKPALHIVTPSKVYTVNGGKEALEQRNLTKSTSAKWWRSTSTCISHVGRYGEQKWHFTCDFLPPNPQPPYNNEENIRQIPVEEDPGQNASELQRSSKARKVWGTVIKRRLRNMTTTCIVVSEMGFWNRERTLGQN